MASADDFGTLSRPAQVARMRSLARTVLAEYPLDVRRLTLLEHGFNTSFRVDTAGGEKFALRLNVNSRRSPENVAAEVAWIAALARDTDLAVAAPHANLGGSLVTTIPSTDLGGNVHAVVFSWLPGRDVGHAPTVEKAHAMGAAMATLHEHTSRWNLPAGAELHALDDVFWGMPDRLDAAHLDLETSELAAVRRAVEIVTATIARVIVGPLRPIHADLHEWNVKWFGGRLSVFDFDDSGLGLPVQDLAVSTYYLRPRYELVEALREGYSTVSPLPEVTEADFETLVAQRNLLLLNDLLVTSNAQYRAVVPVYAKNTVTKIRSWLETGVYRADVEGLLPLG